jgi:hypothetical protein
MIELSFYVRPRLPALLIAAIPAIISLIGEGDRKSVV